MPPSLFSPRWQYYVRAGSGLIVRRDPTTGQLWRWHDDLLQWEKGGVWTPRILEIALRGVWSPTTNPEGMGIVLWEEPS